MRLPRPEPTFLAWTVSGVERASAPPWLRPPFGHYCGRIDHLGQSSLGVHRCSRTYWA